jgi:hypothetical protein
MLRERGPHSPRNVLMVGRRPAHDLTGEPSHLVTLVEAADGCYATLAISIYRHLA